MIRNSEFHNTTDCITIGGYHPNHQNLQVTVGQNPPQKVHKLLIGSDGVYNVVKTNQSQELGKYSIITERKKQQQVKKNIHKIMQALLLRITDIANDNVEKYFNQCPSLR